MQRGWGGICIENNIADVLNNIAEHFFLIPTSHSHIYSTRMMNTHHSHTTGQAYLHIDTQMKLEQTTKYIQSSPQPKLMSLPWIYINIIVIIITSQHLYQTDVQSRTHTHTQQQNKCSCPVKWKVSNTTGLRLLQPYHRKWHVGCLKKKEKKKKNWLTFVVL